MNYKLQAVITKYPLMSNKLVDLYYKEPNIKKFVHLMYRAISSPELKQNIESHLWIIEDLSRYDFNLLIKAAMEGKLSGILQIINMISKEEI